MKIVKDGSFVLKGIIVLLIRIFGAVSAFLVTLAITRTNSLDEAGSLLLIITIISAAGNLFTLGFPQALVRYVAIH